MPNSISYSKLAFEYIAAEEALAKAAKVEKAARAKLKEVEQKILSSMDVDNFSAKGKRFAKFTDTVPRVENWDNLYEWIMNEDRPDILYRRINSRTWTEELEAGLLIPGTEAITLDKLRVTKA